MRRQLHRDKNVIFAGYQIPHPLEYKLIVKVGSLRQSALLKDEYGKHCVRLRVRFRQVAVLFCVLLDAGA